MTTSWSNCTRKPVWAWLQEVQAIMAAGCTASRLPSCLLLHVGMLLDQQNNMLPTSRSITWCCLHMHTAVGTWSCVGQQSQHLWRYWVLTRALNRYHAWDACQHSYPAAHLIEAGHRMRGFVQQLRQFQQLPHSSTVCCIQLLQVQSCACFAECDRCNGLQEVYAVCLRADIIRQV